MTEKSKKIMIGCEWLQDECCVNDHCDCCADFPAPEYCMQCKFYKGRADDERERNV